MKPKITYQEFNKNVLDLRFLNEEENSDYIYSVFPDKSINFKFKRIPNTIVINLKNHDDLFLLCLISDIIEKQSLDIELIITYLMYQQDDRSFSPNQGFGLRVISNILNNLKFSKISVYHPHSDKVEFIKNVEILDNENLVEFALSDIFFSKFNNNNFKNLKNQGQVRWVIPDAGAFKTQFKQLENLKYHNFISCSKSRDEKGITTIVHCDDLNGDDCFIIDDICLGGRTHIQIAEKLKEKKCGDIYLIISHGIFNYGTEHLLKTFKKIYTTDSITKEKESDFLKIYRL